MAELTADEAAEGLDVVSFKMLSISWTTPFAIRMLLVVIRAVELALATKIPDDCGRRRQRTTANRRSSGNSR